MPAPRSHRRARLAVLVSIALAVTGFQLFLAPPAAQAASTTVVINEVYVNGGSAGATYLNKYVELRNLTGTSINLTGMSLQYRAPGTTGATGNVAPLTGTIPANGYYMVIGGTNGAVGAAVPTTAGAFQNSSAISPGNAGGTIALINGGVAVDLSVLANSVDKIGYGTSNAPEGNASGAGPTGNSVTKSIGRKNATDTDVNTADFEAQDPTPNAANPSAVVPLALAPVSNKTGTVDHPINGFSLTASNGTPGYTYSATGLPAGVSVNPTTGAVSGTPTAACACAVTAKVTDSASAEATQAFTFTVTPFTATNPGNKTFLLDEAITPFTIQVTGGVAPFGYAVTNGSLPAGVTLNGTTGEVSGTPTASQAATPVTVTVTDNEGATAATTFSIEVSASEPATRTIQILGTNDFHGRLQRDSGGPTAGAAVLAGAVKQLRASNPDTVFAAAGDLIGASTFESFIQHDKPTIDALNEAGLEVSSVGNHEFDQGFNDLFNRVMQPAGPGNLEGGADWEYLAANITLKSDGSHPIAPSWTRTFGAVKVGFIGAVTEELPSLVSPAGINMIDVNPIVSSVNAEATALKAGGADVIVLLMHEGAAGTDCATMLSDPKSAVMAGIVNGVNNDIDAIISGHTHLSYNCHFPVPGWAGRPVTERPVVSAGQYGMALDKLLFTVDTATGQVTDVQQDTVNLQHCTNCPTTGTQSWVADFPADSATAGIVASAVSQAEPLGAVALGRVGGEFHRGKLTTGSENRGAESTLGNLVAEVQKWATRNPETGSAQIAFMNPGGLRTDMLGNAGVFPRTLTFKQAADVQPFANTLVNMDLTGAQIKTVLEQQWQPAGASRPFLKLGISKGFTYTATPPPAGAPVGTRGTVTGMWLNGTPIGMGTVYSVTVNSFLAAGGDGFTELANGTGKQDTGQSDLNAMVAYMSAFGTAPDQVTPDYKQNGINITFPAGAPDHYGPGDHVKFDVSGWSMTNPADTKDTAILVKQGATTLDTFNLDNTPQAALPGSDVTGKASVDFVLPHGTPEGPLTLTLSGASTGSSFPLTIAVDWTEDLQILGTNDFHGRLQRDSGGPTAGAAVLAGAVKQLRASNPNTVFAAAGDLIGASTFESFIQHDKPTIDALNEAGLEVSSVGNHEFDQGFNDLFNRVMQPAGPGNLEGGADWEYLAANITLKSDGSHPIAPSWTKTMAGVKVGFIGAVTEELPTLVSPAGINMIDVNPIVSSVNAEATALKAGGADVIVLLMHEGAAGTDCATMLSDPKSAVMAGIVNGVNNDIDAIISGHTHLSYNCHFPVPGWAGRPVTERPVVSAGQYGMALDRLRFEYNKELDRITVQNQETVDLQHCTNCPTTGTQSWVADFPADSATAGIVASAVSQAEPLGAVALGRVGGEFHRGKLTTGSENRGAESTLGNLVAEVQKWATRNPETGSAQIAFMNPGGLRTDMLGNAGVFPRTLTFKQAADVQPFANTLVNMDLTGAQIKTVLEQQWQPAGASRPFLKLGISKGFTYTATPPPAGAPVGTRGTVTGMWLNGTPIGMGTVYSVTVNSFLAAGGDGFTELANGTGKQDTGQSDLNAMVAYMSAFGTSPDQVTPDYKQNGINITFPADAPTGYAPGDHVKFDVSGWSMTNPADTKDTAIVVKVGATTLSCACTLDNTPQPALPGSDVTGKASIDVVVPASTLPGPLTLSLSGAATGTESQVTVTAIKAGTTSVTAADFAVEYGQAAQVQVTVSGPGLTPTGTVDLKDGSTVVASGTLDGTGKATITVPALTYPVGQVTLTAAYSGDAQHDASTKSLTFTTTKAASTTSAADGSMEYGKPADVTVNVGAAAGVDVSGTVTVKDGATTVGTAPVVAGVATVTLAAKSLEVGAASLTASYSGNANVQVSDDTFTVTVDKATSVVVAPDVAVPPGGTGSVSVTVTAVGVDPTGTVTVKNGATELGSAPLLGGVAQLTLPAVPNGTVLTAAYAGDEHVKPGTDTFTVTCCDKSTPILAISDVSMQYGQSRTATLTVTGSPGGAATGTATIKSGSTTIGSAPVSGGIATILIPAGALPVGSTVLTAEYSGDANLVAGSKAFTATVTKASSTVSAKVKPKHPRVNHKVKLKVSVVGANSVEATGQVTVKFQGKTYKVTLKNGKATVKLGKLASSSAKAKVTYAGSTTVAGSTTTVKIKAS